MRRIGLVVLAVSLLAASLAVEAQQAAPPARPLIGMLLPISANAAARNVAEFRAALRDLGYVEGQTVVLEIRYADGVPDRLPKLAAELVDLQPSLIFAGSHSGALAARDATRTIPIVVITADDPVAAGLVTSIAKPGGNITGTWSMGDDSLVGLRLQFLKEAVPRLTRVGILLNPDDPADAINYKRVPPAARALGLTFQIFEVRGGAFDTAFARALRAGMQALFVSEAPTFNSRPADIADLAARTGLPAVYGFRAFTAAGGLMSYGIILPALYRRSAELADKILRGARPADLPMELPLRWELVINLKTAKALGLTIPQSLLVRADEIIQ
jgi:putative ABC transport system substrate-binding protein